MSVHNIEIINKLNEVADLLDIKGENQFRVRAYRNAVRTLSGFSKNISDMVKEGEDISTLSGIGESMRDKIEEIEAYFKKEGTKRIKWSEADELVTPLFKYLNHKMDDVTLAGSYRRRKETVGDIDILATSKDSEKAMKVFTGFEETDHILARGETKSSIKLRTGLQVDLRIVDKNEFGSALLYFTGSKEHSIALRKIAQEKGAKLNEYGIFKNNKRIASKSEKEMYEALDLSFIEPELRENKGELEASRKDKLPRLITLDDIRGDLHTHTNETDGKQSLKEMAEAAKKRGYAYYAVTDHSKKVAMANGLEEKRLARQIEEIEDINRKLKNIKILKSIEVDILENGSLDLPDDILKELDLVVCSIHYNRNLSKKKQTSRILKAMDNPYFNILAHPTGRLIGERRGYDIEMETIIKGAKERGCFLEMNANPERLDLNDDHARLAKETGLKIVISTDAHSVDNLHFMEYGVAQARRGWLEKKDVLNTYPWEQLKKLLKRN